MTSSRAAVLFDLDGTLLDTLADLGNAMNAALAHFKYPVHSIHDYRRFIGRGVEQLVSSALPEEARSQVTPVVARFRAEYRKALVVETKPYPGIPELLSALQ